MGNKHLPSRNQVDDLDEPQEFELTSNNPSNNVTTVKNNPLTHQTPNQPQPVQKKLPFFEKPTVTQVKSGSSELKIMKGREIAMTNK